MFRRWVKRETKRGHQALLRRHGQDPENPEILRQLADLSEKEKAYDRAIEYLETLVSKNREDVEILCRIGELLRKAGKGEESLLKITEASRLAPDNLDVKLNLAKAHLALGRTRESEKIVLSLLTTHPRVPVCYYALGLLRTKQGKIDDAIEAYRKAVRIDDDFARAHSNLGLLLEQTGETDEAFVHFRRAIRSEPDRAEWHLNVGAMYGEKRMLKEAILEFREALRCDPHNVEAHFNLGMIFHDRGAYDEAIREFKIALEAEPDNIRAHYLLGRAYIRRGLYDRARKEMNKILGLDPENARAYYYLGVAENKTERVDEAIAALERAIAIDPDYGKPYYFLGIAYDKKGVDHKAREAYRTADRLLQAAR